ncbi:hypothetical protein yinte0001_31290 [Yersinia intermedia ATCC 29909]|nr:hypothetical protein yinte0001_31290 [Yersinia intermedia ATCC 29909]
MLQAGTDSDYFGDEQEWRAEYKSLLAQATQLMGRLLTT